MIRTLQEVFERALERLSSQIVTFLPPLLVGLAILFVAFVLARIVRLLVSRGFKGTGVDRFLRESGFASFLPGAGLFSIAPVVPRALYGLILLLGTLAAVNVFDTRLTSQVVEGTIFLFPRLVGAAAIVLSGFWLAQFLGRSVLVWACNEEIPWPRRLAAAVRVAVSFTAVVVAADVLGFASRVFFAAFVIFAGGAVLTCSLALGLGASVAVRQWLGRSEDQAHEDKRVLSHL